MREIGGSRRTADVNKEVQISEGSRFSVEIAESIKRLSDFLDNWLFDRV